MEVRKFKPSRTPRTLDRLAEAKETARVETLRTSKLIIERSKKLVGESKEIMAAMGTAQKKHPKRRAG
jgi:transcription initiation factor TFIIIB Brf1 subunit/transcription initiation factor TFIIB